MDIEDPSIEESGASSEDDRSFDMLVEEALARVPTNSIEVECEPTESEEQENQLVVQYMAKGCGCLLNNGQQCSSQFTTEYVLDVRASCLELTRNELDMVLLGQLMASTDLSETVGQKTKHKEAPRQRTAATYHHHLGKTICTPMFGGGAGMADPAIAGPIFSLS